MAKDVILNLFLAYDSAMDPSTMNTDPQAQTTDPPNVNFLFFLINDFLNCMSKLQYVVPFQD